MRHELDTITSNCIADLERFLEKDPSILDIEQWVKLRAQRATLDHAKLIRAGVFASLVDSMYVALAD